jgi:Uma2 family endonuclease
MSSATLHEIDYPDSDGKPLAETPLHMRVMWDSIQTLNYWYADDLDVYVWGNMFLYYVKGDPTKAVSPDVMVVKGVDKNKFRDVFKTWEERRRPSAILEITSQKTRREDQKDKFQLYRDELKVKEYFLFDPRADYLKQALRGFRLRSGEYLPIAEIDGRVPSKVLELHLQRDGRELRFWNPVTKKWLPNAEELQAFERSKREMAERERDLERGKRALAEAEIERSRREIEASNPRKGD